MFCDYCNSPDGIGGSSGAFLRIFKVICTVRYPFHIISYFAFIGKY